MIKPKRLKKGDTIAVVALSWNGNEYFPHIVDKGIERLEEFGFNIIRGDTLNYSNDELYKNPKLRADDLHKQFLDPNVNGIISIIGGSESVRVLEYIDLNIIKNNSKFLMGFSDISTYLTYINSALNIVTFNGPTIMAGFAESKKLEDDFVEYIEKFIFNNWDEFEYIPFKRYTNKYLDWSDSSNLEKENTNYIDNLEGFKSIQGDEIVQRELFGGCIEVLEFLKGTKFWPEEDFWEGKILFFETSEEKPTPQMVEFFLRNYATQGILQQINGIVFGRARDYNEDEKIELENVILKILKECGREDLPVLTNVDFGHTDPQFIMPLGIKAEINPKLKSFKLVEGIWRD